LVGEDGGVDEWSGLSNDFRNAEFNVGDIIFGGFEEDWDNVLGNLILHYVWHNSSEGVEATHSVIVSFFVDRIMADYDWDEIIHDPILFEGCSKNCTLFDTHFSNTGGSVG
jgi:hypothetical protein